MNQLLLTCINKDTGLQGLFLFISFLVLMAWMLFELKITQPLHPI